MARIGIKDVAVRLGMTVSLIDWCSGHAPKGDGAKLKPGPDGRFEETEVEAFDAALWAAWPDRNVPAEFARELRREAAGRCGICGDPCDVMEEAHIRRKDKELAHYCQHPHNLILACPTCHTRYDRDSKSMITLDVVLHRKKGLQSRLLEDVQRDLAFAVATEEATRAVLELFQGWGTARGQPQPGLLHDGMQVILDAVAPSGELPLGIATQFGSPQDFVSAVATAGGALQHTLPATSGVLVDFAQHVMAPPTGWRPSVDGSWQQHRLIERSQCTLCSAPRLIEQVVCAQCDEEAPQLVDVDASLLPCPSGAYRFLLPDPRMKTSGENALCQDCGHDEFHVDFDWLCGGCKHMTEKED